MSSLCEVPVSASAIGEDLRNWGTSGFVRTSGFIFLGALLKYFFGEYMFFLGFFKKNQRIRYYKRSHWADTTIDHWPKAEYQVWVPGISKGPVLFGGFKYLKASKKHSNL